MRVAIQPFLFLFPALFLCLSCYSGDKPSPQTVLIANGEGKSFAEYWYNGEGELNTFELEQTRYGETRKGEAIMVFVAESFSKSKQVKSDNPDIINDDKVSILKLNHIRRFVTGIYDYSMMQSVFTPIDLKKRAPTLKTTTTSQDWCGHSFLQLNKEDDKYLSKGFSYFESEGDSNQKLKPDLLEDELWTQIRINPNSIKEGNYNMLPSSFYLRLSHDPLKVKQARITIRKQDDINSLILEYLHLDRTLSIDYTSLFPHKIVSWTEVQNGKIMSKGKLKASVKSAYWHKHGNQFEHLRDSLGI